MGTRNIFINFNDANSKDAIDELPEIEQDMDSIDSLPDVIIETDDLDELPEIYDENEHKNLELNKQQKLFKKVDSLISNDLDESDVEKRNKLKDIVRYCNPVEMIKTVGYFYSWKTMLEINMAYDIANRFSKYKLDNSVVEEIRDVYMDVVTPQFIKENFQNTLLDVEHVADEMTKITCDTVEATVYITGKATTGVVRVVEDTVDFAVGTVADLAGHPEIAEKLYNADISGKISDYLDEHYSESDLVKDIGQCAEKVGEVATYIGLSILTGGENVIIATASTVALGVARAGSSTRNAVEKTGQYTHKQLTCGVVNGILAVVSVKLADAIGTGMKDVVAPKLQKLSDHIGNDVAKYIAEKGLGFVEAATVSGFDTLIFESQEVLENYVEAALDIEEAEEIDWKKMAKNAGVGALIGGSVYLASDLINNVGKFIEKKSKWKNYAEDLMNSSECPETINLDDFDINNLTKRTPEETKALRQEFNRNKDRLIEEWEKANNQKWPVYEKDILNEYGEVIKKAGWKYDAHHIQPLTLGGENVASNITPLRYDIHSDHRGVHAFGSPYDVLEKYMKEVVAND